VKSGSTGPSASTAALHEPPANLFGKRTYLDDLRTWRYRHQVYRERGASCGGVAFCANDTFGHFVPLAPLGNASAV